MGEYAGSASVVQWITSAGTLAMSGDTRSLTITPSQDTIDSTAGSDTSKQFIPSFTTWDVSWEGVAQDGTAGTAYMARLAPSTAGTLKVWPFGTAGSASLFTMPAFSMGAAISMPYSDVTTISANWSQSSGGTATWGTA
ncbi:MAG: hypothetical protein IPO08_25270 [Xanthomonadales bacterium]|nr:hypothetical protein [Xanthomonadales bacterium]